MGSLMPGWDSSRISPVGESLSGHEMRPKEGSRGRSHLPHFRDSSGVPAGLEDHEDVVEEPKGYFARLERSRSIKCAGGDGGRGDGAS